jgi:hypothetical protein
MAAPVNRVLLVITAVLSASLAAGVAACGGGDDKKTAIKPAERRAAGSSGKTDAVARGYVPKPSPALSSARAARGAFDRNLPKADPTPLLVGPNAKSSTAPPVPQGSPGRIRGEAAAPSGRDLPQPPAGRATGIGTDAAEVPFKRKRWTGSSTSPPASMEVVIQFTRNGKYHSCSGTVVNSPSNESVVWTAGHCLYFGDDPSTRDKVERPEFSTNVLLAPGYHQKQAPYGVWRARAWNVPKAWVDGFNESPPFANDAFDLGAIAVNKRGGKTLQQAVGGGQGIEWNYPGNPAIDSFGYPGEPPFDGEHLIVCDSRVGVRAIVREGTPPTVGIGCDMNGGSSGGGWIRNFDPQAGWGTVYSVNSYGYPGQPIMYGPYQGEAAANLFAWAQSK